MLIRDGFLYLFVLCSIFSISESRRGGSGGSRGGSRSRSASRHRATFIKRTAKPGSVEKTSLFRSTILGATAGYVTFQAGRHLINSPSSVMRFEGRSYYWDSSMAPAVEELPVQCSHPIDPNDPQLGKLVFPDETRPREIVYNCKDGESCCGFECCQENSFFKSLFALLVIILVISIIGIFCIECFRWGIQCMYNWRTRNVMDLERLNT